MKWCPQDCETEARLTKRIAELEAAISCVEAFLDGWHMPDVECQKEADDLLAHVKSVINGDLEKHDRPPCCSS